MLSPLLIDYLLILLLVLLLFFLRVFVNLFILHLLSVLWVLLHLNEVSCVRLYLLLLWQVLIHPLILVELSVIQSTCVRLYFLQAGQQSHHRRLLLVSCVLQNQVLLLVLLFQFLASGGHIVVVEGGMGLASLIQETLG